MLFVDNVALIVPKLYVCGSKKRVAVTDNFTIFADT